MKLAIISDTHGSLFYFEKAYKYLKEADRVIHLGDYLYHGPRNPLPEGYNPMELSKKLNEFKRKTFITGNCDSQIDMKLLNIPEPVPYAVESYGSFNFFFTHGWNPTIEDAENLAKKYKCQFLIHGHTHIPKFEEKEDITIINPGSVSLPKNNTPHSILIVEINDSIKFEFIDIIKDEKYELK
ncbi:phosphoesterase, MJ0936 family [Marinitoga piezophila KA3]|uniref:Phosphoesterase n=1 Tax=Marinitoga piezophila (strain DSM 14283 / JCM 11233 / KA3) TaxID=443254 RepID=H2J3U8_MARPK|nr:phosphodiesterase [Marinitoga piezophila]AEX85840.1 phosphoesterase, MJ0936 family [Marinitoga piezophila KA3]